MSGTAKDLGSMSMMDLFRQEVESHCATLSGNLLRLEKNPADSDGLNSLMRAAHSIKGAARIMELHGVVKLAHAMEDMFVAAQEGRIILDADCIDQLLMGVDKLAESGSQPDETMADWLAGQEEEFAKLQKMYAVLSSARDDKKTPQPSGAPEKKNGQQQPASLPERKTEKGPVDLSSMSMFDLFRQEAENHCAVLAKNLLALENDAHDSEALASLMRAAHSIKGAARIINLQVIVGLAHAMEDMFVAAQEDRLVLEQEQVDHLLGATDLIGEIAALEDSGLDEWFRKKEQPIRDLEKSLHDSAAGKKRKPAAKEPAPVLPAVKAAQDIKPEKTRQQEDMQQADRALRVSAEGMNRLMGFAGEVRVESRWLPSLAGKVLRLKHRQDGVHRLLHQYAEILGADLANEVSRNSYRNLIAGLDICRNQVTDLLSEVEDHARRAAEISHHLYQEVLANRMRPFADGVKGFPRMVRDVARELGKKVRFDIIGEETLVDRDILEKIESSLNHLIRNAIDHGIETPEKRLEAGKPETAVIRLEARHSAGMLNIIVSDDGRGIDIEKLRETVIDRKMIGREPARQLRESELLEFLFLPNFSTRTSVSTVSGRGVGLDVVHSAVHEVRGIIRTSTELGSGTVFEMQLPLTLSVMRSLLVEISKEIYAFPLVSIEHVLRLKEKVREVEGRQYITFNRERIGLVSASQVLEKEEKQGKPEDQEELPVLILNDHHNRYGLIIDKFLGIRDLVVQPLDRRLQKVQDISAVAILEDGTPVLIVDVEDMVRSIDSLISGNRLRRIAKDELMTERSVKRILVVDDSITVREVERKMLAVKGYDVQTAVDGQDGWNAVRNQSFDLVVSDIDMPRMNGIEMVSLIRQDPRFEALPIIIVSYKDREEDRNRGLEAGADYYLTKGSFQDETLVNAVEDLIGTPFKN